MLPVEDILEDLELPRAEPGPGYLERLFARFVERVPFESASKIRRDARVAARPEKPRTPDVFWRERLEEGAGGTCFARVAAFHALITELGFSSRLALGRVLADGDHAALFVRAGGAEARGEWICDVGFPLPALVPARPGQVETGMGPVEVRRSERGWEASFEWGAPSDPRRLEVFEAPVGDSEFAARWEATFRSGSKFLSGVLLRKQLESRAVSFAHGEIRVDDRHSRTRIPLGSPSPSPRAAALEEIFGTSAALLEEAFAIVGDPEPDATDAEVAVYLESPASAETAWRAIASPAAYGELYAGVAAAAAEVTGPRTWRARLDLPEGANSTVIEDVDAHDGSRTLLVVRQEPVVRGSWAVEEHAGSAFLVRKQRLAGPRLDLLRNDSLRGRLAGSLAVDLLSWARRISNLGELTADS